MADTTLHSCSTCNPETQPDCATCKLAFLSEKSRKHKKKSNTEVEEGDYSISERITDKENDHSILYLVIAAVATLILVVVFTKLFMH